ncbi:MAG: hypothetical protein CSA84_06160 [Actinomycetales bacterium]|nr:MAG: hypothetical protein CSA84_06160 [Actinomycetales bacterium]
MDGPLNPYAAPWFGTMRAADGYDFHEVGPIGGFEALRVALNPRHGLWLRCLTEIFDLVWATSWCDDADRLLAPLLRLPRELPVIDLVPPRIHHGQHCWKTDRIAEWVGQRPFVWVDDEINHHTHDRLAGFPWLGPHLALRIEPHLGLRETDIDLLVDFARRL